MYIIPNENYERTGESFSGSVKDKKGSYEITKVELASSYVEMEATGKYINEITNSESQNSITLKAIADIANKDKININVFTHLEHDRVLLLVKKGSSFAAAKKQAFAEVLTSLGIDPVSGNSEDMSLQADSVLLLASVLLQVGRLESDLKILLKTLNGIEAVKNGMATALENYATAKDNVQSSSSLGGSSSSITVTEGTFIDDRDSKTYKLVKIDSQTWMAENLNYDVPNNDDDVCYDNNPANCTKYGRLYDWATAMALPSKCNSTLSTSDADCAITTPYHKGICPTGWHIPSNADWNVLMKFVNPSCSDNSSCATAGTKLKATSGWNSGGNGQDTYGFSALPGGYGNSDGYFFGVGDGGEWWGASEVGSDVAYERFMYYSIEYVSYNVIDKDRLFSVRCVQD